MDAAIHDCNAGNIDMERRELVRTDEHAGYTRRCRDLTSVSSDLFVQGGLCLFNPKLFTVQPSVRRKAHHITKGGNLTYPDADGESEHRANWMSRGMFADELRSQTVASCLSSFYIRHDTRTQTVQPRIVF